MRLAYLLCAAVFATGSAAFADVTYTYTGQYYDDYRAPYTASDRVTGTFTIANPPGPNLDGQMAAVLSFSFNDGIETVGTGTANPFFTFYTDASGNITGYDLESVFGTGDQSGDPYGIIDAYYFSGSLRPDGVPVGGTQATPDVFGGSSAGSEHAGTLVESTTVTPEPSTFALFGTGLLGLGGLVRRRVMPG